MRRAVADFYRSPQSIAPLQLRVEEADRDDIIRGQLSTGDGELYTIADGIVDFTYPRPLPEVDERAREFYDGRVEDYDRYLPLTFRTFGEDEDAVRADMVDRLGLKRDSRVLEIGCGSGRDSLHLARRIPQGELYCQDISPRMVAACRERMRNVDTMFELSIANASYLPFADRSFDAVFQFGGVGEFSYIGRFFREVVRVTRPGGRVVVGDESMPVWLRNTEFAKTLTLTNPQFNAPVPFDHLPIQARNVNVRWIIGGTFYLIDFTVGEGEPPADFNFPIPGVRGGTHMTRLKGQLEGVTLETKALALRARALANVSMHDWLDAVVREAAQKQIGEHGPDDRSDS